MFFIKTITNLLGTYSSLVVFFIYFWQPLFRVYKENNGQTFEIKPMITLTEIESFSSLNWLPSMTFLQCRCRRIWCFINNKQNCSLTIPQVYCLTTKELPFGQTLRHRTILNSNKCYFNHISPSFSWKQVPKEWIKCVFVLDTCHN